MQSYGKPSKIDESKLILATPFSSLDFSTVGFPSVKIGLMHCCDGVMKSSKSPNMTDPANWLAILYEA